MQILAGLLGLFFLLLPLILLARIEQNTRRSAAALEKLAGPRK